MAAAGQQLRLLPSTRKFVDKGSSKSQSHLHYAGIQFPRANCRCRLNILLTMIMGLLYAGKKLKYIINAIMLYYFEEIKSR